MNKTITIEDIARQAGVSTSTVSRVLNGSKRVADDKRALVLAAIEQHQYRPNTVARGLVRGRSMTVGVLMQDITSPFFARMVSGIEQGLDRAAYWPVFASTHWRADHQDDEARSLRLLLERRVDGVIVLASSIPDEELRAIAQQIPLVVVARRVQGLEPQCVYVDNHGGAYRATRYLLGLGHTHIAHITGTPSHPDAVDRLEGYRDALADAGIAVDEQLIVQGAFVEESGLAAVEQLLTRGKRFTALFAANDQLAYGAMLGLFNHGYRIPTDMSLVGFDDQFLSAYTLPPLTTIRQPSIEMGHAAAEGLLRLLNNEAPMLPEFPTDLIIRKSAVHARQNT
jgi:LacI family transcriptional regulator